MDSYRLTREDQSSQRKDEGGGDSNAVYIQRTVIIQRDENGYGLTVRGDNPVYVESVKTDGAASRAGVQTGDRIVKVNGTLVTNSSHIEVVKRIKSGSFVAITLLNKPPGGSTSATDRPPGERTSVGGVLGPSNQIVTEPQPVDEIKAREFQQLKQNELRKYYQTAEEEYEKLKKQHQRNPSEKLHAQLLEKEKTVKTLAEKLQIQQSESDNEQIETSTPWKSSSTSHPLSKETKTQDKMTRNVTGLETGVTKVTETQERRVEEETGLKNEVTKVTETQDKMAWNVVELKTEVHTIEESQKELAENFPQLNKDVKIPKEILQMDQISIDIYKKALMEGKEPDHTIRLEVVGQRGVGKTSLINRLLKLGLDCKEIKSTNGIDIHVNRSAVNVHNGKWIFNEDEVRKFTNHESRLAEIVKKYKNEMENFDIEEKIVIEKNSGLEDETVTKSLSFEEDHGDNIEVSTDYAEELVFSTREEFTPLKEDDDEKINEEYLKVQEASKIRNSNDIVGQIYVWDFGGDFIFYTTHQIFLSPRAIYLVVFDITKELFEEFEDNSNDECYFDISGVTYLKMGEYIVFWLNSIHTYASGDKDGVPPVILVATHLDKLKGDQESKIEQLFDNIKEYLKQNGMSLFDHLDDKDFQVNNTESADDSVFEELRQKIFEVAKAQECWGEEKPAKWITFEKLLLEKKKNGIKLLSFEEVMELNKGMKSRKMDQEQLNVFLKFQHAIGNLIYFSDLNEYVVLDPKWLIDAFRCLITHSKFHRNTPFAIKSDWNKFTKTAELEMKLIDALWKDIEKKHRKHLLGLMDKLDIIVKPRIYKGIEDSNSEQKLDYYFVPLMLKEKITDDQLRWVKKNAWPTPNMYFVFENHFMSPSVFHRLIAACMKKWDVACQGNKKLLFCGSGIFNTDQSETTRIMISMENYRIKVCILHYHSEAESGDIVADDLPKSVEIRTFVEDALKIIFGRYQQNVSHKLHLECRSGGGGLIAVEKLKKYPKVNCSSHEECHIVWSRNLLKYWFHPEEYQNMVDTDEVKNLTDLPYGFSDHCPSEKQLSAIANNIGIKLYPLGIELGLTSTDIEMIQFSHPNDCYEQCFQILVQWKRKSGKGTLDILHKAMREVGCDVQVLISVCKKEFLS